METLLLLDAPVIAPNFVEAYRLELLEEPFSYFESLYILYKCVCVRYWLTFNFFMYSGPL